jgi:hypothetical protein
VKVYDGVVLGAESMTQISGQAEGRPQFIKAYSNARKLFQVSTLPVGVLTYGLGNIGNRSVESFVQEFSETVTTGSSVEEIAGNFLTFIRGHYDQQFRDVPQQNLPVVGFYIAGYTSGRPLATEREFVLPQHETPVVPRSDDDFGASWRGIALPFTRLYSGVDPRLYDILREQGIADELIHRVKAAAGQRLIAPVAFPGMPVKDAIGFCKFIVETTVYQALYEIGVPSCGGPLQIGAITKAGGFEWVQKLQYCE